MELEIKKFDRITENASFNLAIPDGLEMRKIAIDFAKICFKQYLVESIEGNYVNSKNTNRAIFDVSGSILIPDVNSEKNLILARAINYISDDVQEDGNKLAKEIVEGLIALLDK